VTKNTKGTTWLINGKHYSGSTVTITFAKHGVVRVGLSPKCAGCCTYGESKITI
jgi:hypothetical protein